MVKITFLHESFPVQLPGRKDELCQKLFPRLLGRIKLNAIHSEYVWNNLVIPETEIAHIPNWLRLQHSVIKIPSTLHLHWRNYVFNSVISINGPVGFLRYHPRDLTTTTTTATGRRSFYSRNQPRETIASVARLSRPCVSYINGKTRRDVLGER